MRRGRVHHLRRPARHAVAVCPDHASARAVALDRHRGGVDGGSFDAHVGALQTHVADDGSHHDGVGAVLADGLAVKIRILEVLATLKRAGAERTAVTLAGGLDPTRFETELVSLYDAFPTGFEPELDSAGIPVHH